MVRSHEYSNVFRLLKGLNRNLITIVVIKNDSKHRETIFHCILNTVITWYFNMNVIISFKNFVNAFLFNKHRSLLEFYAKTKLKGIVHFHYIAYCLKGLRYLLNVCIYLCIYVNVRRFDIASIYKCIYVPFW